MADEQDLDDAIFAAERYGNPIPGASTPCDGTRGIHVYDAHGRRRIKCERCDATFMPIPYEVGAGGIPFHQVVREAGA